MSELGDVLSALEASGGRGAALATVVAVEGSTYRRAGARLVVPADGEPVGNISGGCLEGDVVATAREVVADGQARLLHFDLTADDEALWGWGLGCNGAIDVFVEPAEGAQALVAALRATAAGDQPSAVVTVAEGAAAGARIVMSADGRVEGRLGPDHLDAAGRRLALEALATGTSGLVTVDGDHRAFVEVLRPPTRLVVCGAGGDAVPLVELAAGLGWQVVVVDHRPALLSAPRFPGAARRVRAEPLRAAEEVGVDERTCVVVMSHNFPRDRDYLQAFLARPPAYLGMLGPRARLERLVDDLQAAGVAVDSDSLDRVYGPAGLDLGAEGPQEVAWAIIAEILAVRRGAGGGSLRDRTGAIHGPASLVDVTA